MKTATNNKTLCSNWAHLEKWFEEDLGRALLQAEEYQLSQALPDLFGYHLVQVGAISQNNLLGASRISHRVVLTVEPLKTSPVAQGPVCLAAALPLATQSVDVVLLHHLLEFDPNPHQVLREVERVLIGEGHAVIIGFNPWSLWGLWKLGLGWRGQPPWCGCFFSQRRVKDWLRLLGFDIVRARHFFFRAPIKSPKMTGIFDILNKTGAARWPYCGGAYIVVAKKRLVTLTPIPLNSRARRLVPDEVVEPCPMVDS